MNGRPSGSRIGSWLLFGAVLLMSSGCDSATDPTDPAGTTIPPRGRRGVGVPLLTQPVFQEVVATGEAYLVPPGSSSGWAVDLTSAPDGLSLRLAGTFVDPEVAACNEVRVPGIWTPGDGWTRIATTEGDQEYTMQVIGDGGHLLGRSGPSCGGAWWSVYWGSDSTPEVAFNSNDFRFGNLNSAGQVVGTVGGPSNKQLLMVTPDGSGGLTYRNLQHELLEGLGYTSSWGIDINVRGQILAHARSGDSSENQVILIDGDVVHDLSAGLDLGWFDAIAMNNADPVQAVGVSYGDGPARVFRWTLFSEEEIIAEVLPDPTGSGRDTRASDIDDAGTVVGDIWGDPLIGERTTVLWTESAGEPAVVIVGDGSCEGPGRPQLDSHAHLVGLTRVLDCGTLHEFEVD